MNFSMIRFGAVAAVISLAGIAQAQGIRDAGSKIRGDYGMVSRSQSYYAAPRSVYQAPVAVAQTPVDRRSFSAQPGQPSAAPDGCNMSSQAMTGQTQPSSATRSFSFAPTEPTYRAAPRVYSSPSSGIRDAGSKIRGW